MNGLLFLLPFILVASIGIYQDSFAVSQITGYDYFDVTNPDGSHTWSTHEPYVFDGNNWVPFIASGTTIQTDLATVTLNSTGSFNWNGKFTDTIVAKYADITNLNSWTYPNTLNNDTPDVSWDGEQLVSSKTKSGVGQLDYKYILVNGKWKTQLEATNLSSLNTKVFGFDQIIDLYSDTIKFGGATRNLDNFHGQTFDKQFLIDNEGKILDLLNGVNFDFDIGFENLYSVTVYDTGVNKSRLVFDYRMTGVLLPGEILIIDPTFTSSTPSTEGRVYSLDTAAGACSTTLQGSDGTMNIKIPSSAVTDNCQGDFVNFDVSSLSGLGITGITNGQIEYDITNSGSPLPCDWKHLDFTGAGNQATYDATVYDSGSVTDILQSSTTCQSGVGNGYVDSFDTGSYGTLFISDIDGDGIISLGVFFNTTSRDGTTRNVTFRSADMILSFDYVTGSPPNPVTSMSYANLSTNSVDILWDAPDSFGSGTFQTYVLNSTTPWGAPLTFNQNSTSLFANVTGLTFGTDYSFRVSAATEVAYNTTGSYILNVTTSTTEYSLPPVLTKVFPDGYTSTSQLNLEWTACSMDNINGYRIAREAPVGGGFSNIVSNSTTTTTYYNNTGLSTNTYYNYKVYCLNGTGISTASNTYVMTTYHLPDAVTDLVASATDLITIILDWTQPTLYGTITGYQINYTTPYGDPTTIITNSTGSSDVTYEITGLSGGNEYSFRVAPVTFHGTNATGNIANATAFQNFEIGSIEFPTGDNPNELFEITFENYEHNSTATDVQVVYDSSMDLTCDFSFVNGNTNQTYSGLTQTAISGSSVYSNFTLQNPNNEIIDIYCYDSLDAANDARHRLTNTVYSDIPIINQILGFQSGDYGTTGMFGAIDLITLLIVIISIIGFNRVNPAVGVIFMFMMLGIMSYFELIEIPTAIIGIIILIITLAIASVKKA